MIFTSGTTGDPKGVELSYSAYSTSSATFEQFLGFDEATGCARHLVALLANPLHHTNSSAILDWAMRRPGSEVILLAKYTTQYWSLLASAATGVPLSSAEAPV